MTEVIKIDKDYIWDLIEEYKRAIDILGLAEVLPLEEHKAKIKRIRKMEQKLTNHSKIILEVIKGG